MEKAGLIFIAIAIVALVIGVARYAVKELGVSTGKAIIGAVIIVLITLGFCGIRLF